VVWDDMTFLINEIDEDQQIQTKGIIQRCTQTLNFYKNNILYEIPIYIEQETKLYSLGVDSNNYISTPSTAIIAQLSNNTTTQLIERDDIFKIGINSYKVVDINDITRSGLLTLKLEYSEEAQETIPTTQPTYAITGDEVIRVGSTKTYIGVKYVNGIASSTATFTFSVVGTTVPVTAYEMTVVDDVSVSIECIEYPYSLTIRATDDADASKYVDMVVKLSNIM